MFSGVWSIVIVITTNIQLSSNTRIIWWMLIWGTTRINCNAIVTLDKQFRTNRNNRVDIISDYISKKIDDTDIPFNISFLL